MCLFCLPFGKIVIKMEKIRKYQKKMIEFDTNMVYTITVERGMILWIRTIFQHAKMLVMKVIWDSTEELALQEVMDGVNHENGKNWKPQTVSTFLSRSGKERLSEYVPQG